MAALVEANRGHAHAYGMDELCKLTEQEFKRVFGPNVEAHYVFTGTAANVLGLAPLVKSFEAVIASDTSHLVVDECAAPEKFLNCKLWQVPTEDGRIKPEQIERFIERQGDQHFPQARVVSLTQPTELGTCYSIQELQAWRKFTRDKNLMLHLDGARLTNAAATLKCSLRELTGDLGADVVSFGGTKNGLMGAEAVLLFTPQAKENFKFYRKQGMQLSSKTRFLAAQFYAYFKDDLHMEIARHTTGAARALAEALSEFKEIHLPYAVESNAIFAQIPKPWIAPLREKFFFYVWDPKFNLCRWMISYDWTAQMQTDFLEAIREVKKCFPVK